MDSTTLVEPHIPNVEAGAELLKRLDAASMNVQAAVWFLGYADQNSWSLIIATPLVETRGPRKIYATTRRILESMNESRDDLLRAVVVVSPNDSVLKLLRMGVHTGPGVSQIRFSQNAINGVLIRDALIYRLL